MKIIQIILQKAKASKLWFAMAVVFIAILNVSAVEAKSLKKGEEFKQKNGWGIRVISSDEVEVDGQGNDIFLGKYTVDGEKVRVVTSAFGTAIVMYYKITPDGLVAEKDGTVYYSQAGLAAAHEAQEKMKIAEAERQGKVRIPTPVLPKAIAGFMSSRGLKTVEFISKNCNFDLAHGNPNFISGDFDGDKRLDYAIRTEKEHDWGHGYVFLANGQIHDLGGMGDFIYKGKRGEVIHAYEGDTTPKYESIGGAYCEKSSFMWVYNEKKKGFDKFTTGD